jgi:hypothetical protein
MKEAATAKATRPRRCSEKELAKVGVTLIDSQIARGSNVTPVGNFGRQACVAAGACTGATGSVPPAVVDVAEMGAVAMSGSHPALVGRDHRSERSLRQAG